MAQETDHPCPPAALAPRRAYDAAPYHAQVAGRGVNRVLYVVVRAFMQPFFHVYFRMRRVGMQHIPKTGPVIFAANHRSFLDPFVIGMLTRRPVYYVAKRELFENPVQAWLLNRLGAFPVERGEGDQRSMSTARAILARGDCVVIFPEGTRIRGGPLRTPKRGVGRLALETGAPIVPVAVVGTDRVRRGLLIRPCRVRVRCGAPLRFPHHDRPSPKLASAVTRRVWPCVELQWQWLGGEIADRPAMPAQIGSSGARAA
ncbi:MAG TPA: lysophospholipid acyltransferase family protein [Solirubrobacteraceae bacterium]|nr:lysophospholipid acyltransferase family protein [Solirubrobacteraceae bacterium]